MAGQAGITYTQAQFNELIGGVAGDLSRVMAAIETVFAYIDPLTGAALDALYSYDVGEGDAIRGAYIDLNQLRTIYEGTANLAVAKDFRAWAKQLGGIPI